MHNQQGRAMNETTKLVQVAMREDNTIIMEYERQITLTLQSAETIHEPKICKQL